MARLLGSSYAVWARIRLPDGSAIYGVPIRKRRSRRIKRAREKAELRQALAASRSDT